MIEPKQTFSFSLVMRSGLLLLFCILSIKTFAQEKYVEGIVFDADTKDRIAIVNITNLNTGLSMYNNLNGVFKVEAKPGDVLVFRKMEYHSDTITVEASLARAIYMKRTGIQLKEVTILDSMSSPKSILATNKKLYSRAYGVLANRDLLSISPSGVGLSIDALYNMFSREGRNAQHLRDAVKSEYRQSLIDYRFNKTFVGRITGLKDAQLIDFMKKYRPGYYFITNASEYELISSIKANLRRYRRNPLAYELPLLYPAK